MKIQNLKFYAVHALCLAIVMLAATVQFNTYLAPDLGWHLNIAKGMLAGKSLYVDFFEVNTPLIIYITQIPILISKVLHINIVLGLNIFNFMLAIMSFMLCRDVINRSGDNAALLPFTAFALFITPLSYPVSEFGQKEHVFMMLFMPYLLEFVLCVKPRAWIFVLACMGMLIKPFFIMAYLGIFIVRLIEKDKIFKREIILFGSINIAFCIWMLVMHKPYFETIIPIALDGYINLTLSDGSYKSNLSKFFLISLYTLNFFILPLILTPLVLTNKSVRLMPIILTLFIMVLVQGKSFWYHYMPMIMACVVLFGFLFMEYLNDNKTKQFLKAVNLTLIAGCLLSSLLPLENNYLDQDNKIKKNYAEVIESIRQYKDKKILVLSFDLAYMFPVAQYANIEWSMKEHSLQILEGIFKNPEQIETKNKSLQYVISDVIESMKDKPTAVFVMQPTIKLTESSMTAAFFFKAGHNYIDFFSQYPEFKQLWRLYKLKGEVGNATNRFKIYELKEGA